MDWGSERYVRLFTRDTPEWLCWPWQARALWPLLLRKLDRSGVLQTKLGPKGIAVLVSMPEDITQTGLCALLDDGCVRLHELGYVVPNFIEAQETPHNNAHRQAEWRQRRARDKVVSTTKSNATLQPVTARNETLQLVTMSNSVLCCSVPSPSPPLSLSLPPSGKDLVLANEVPFPDVDSEISTPTLVRSRPQKSSQRKARAVFEATEVERESAMRVLSKLSERNGVQYQGSVAHLRLIIGRLREGRSELDLRKVIAFCAEPQSKGGKGWEDDEKMRQYLTPETLFGPETIQRYIDAALSFAAKAYPQQQQRKDAR